MNPHTNELALAFGQHHLTLEAYAAVVEALGNLGPDLERVPPHLNRVLQREPRGKISRVSRGALSQHAARRRGELRQVSNSRR